MVKNLSYTYLLPLLSEQVNLKRKILNSILCTYLHTNKDNSDNYFYILCKFKYNEEDFSKLEQTLISNDLYVDSYDINNTILYKFKFPEIYKEEYLNFKQGLYSKYKKDAKLLILEFWTELYGHIPSFVSGGLLKIKRVLNKDPKLRIQLNKELGVQIDKDSELGDIINIKEETFMFPNEEKKVELKDLNKIF